MDANIEDEFKDAVDEAEFADAVDEPVDGDQSGPRTFTDSDGFEVVVPK